MTGQKVEGQCGGGDPILGATAMTDEPARYLAIGHLCLEPGWREIKDGAEFEHDGPPTNGMKPLNRSARLAKLASISPRWRETRPLQIRRLAASLGYTGGTDAAAFIEKWIRETESQNHEETRHDHAELPRR
jgi:hypothetical protein